MNIALDLDVCMEQYKKRRYENEGKQIDNASLYAGSPMYYYCRFCGILTMRVPESYCGQIKEVCDPCEVLHAHGLI
jgi:rubrerythrin